MYIQHSFTGGVHTGVISLGLRTDFPHLSLMAGLGYDYLELPLARIASLSEEQFREFLEYADAIGLRAEVLYDMLPPDIRVNGSDVKAQRQHQYLDMAFARARQLGAKVLIFDAFEARGVPPVFDFQMARRQTGNFLRILQGHAAGMGMRIAIQSSRHARCNLINTVSEASLIAALLQLSDVGVLADTVEMAHVSEPLSVIPRASGALAHVVTGNALRDALPDEGDGEDYEKLFSVLAGMSYDGRVTAKSAQSFTTEAAQRALYRLKQARSRAFR